MYDIDDLIEPRKRGQKPRDPFAQSLDQINKGHGGIWEYQVLGQNSGYNSPRQQRLYHEKLKGERAHIEYMSPDEYFNKIDKGFRSNVPEHKQYEVEPQILENYNNPKLLIAAKRGDKFGMPYIEYNEGEFAEQEGRHRAKMAKDLGVEKMPVVIIDKKREYRDPDFDMDDDIHRKKKQNPFTYDDDEIWEDL
jgi:hypothetical protein